MYACMQVVSCMDEVHINVGIVLLLLHTLGIRLLPGIAWQPLCGGHYWPDCFPYRHSFAFLFGLQRQPDVPNDL